MADVLEAAGPAEFVARWHLDRTYLRPGRKRAVAGAQVLLSELGRSCRQVHIISSGPPQLRWMLVDKLAKDQVRWDELTLRPTLSDLMHLRLRTLSDQLGYKLSALLEARVHDQELRDEAKPRREVLLGDDSDSDAFVYSLYADVLTGRVDRSLLRQVLREARVYSDQAERCLDALSRVFHVPAVERILVHLNRQIPPSSFDEHGSRLVPFHNYLQAAFVLAEDRIIDAAAVLKIAEAFVLYHGFDHEALARSYLDLMRRSHVHGTITDSLWPALQSLRPHQPPQAADQLSRMGELLGRYEQSPPAPVDRRPGELDYVALARRNRAGLVFRRFATQS